MSPLKRPDAQNRPISPALTRPGVGRPVKLPDAFARIPNDNLDVTFERQYIALQEAFDQVADKPGEESYVVIVFSGAQQRHDFLNTTGLLALWKESSRFINEDQLARFFNVNIDAAVAKYREDSSS